MNYNFDEVIECRGFGSIKWDTVREGILPMFVADMDFHCAPQIAAALQKRLSYRVFGYGRDPELPDALIQWLREEYALEVQPDWIVLLPAIVPVLSAVSRLRDGPVLINTPNYHVLLGAPLKAGKRTILSPLKNAGEYYQFDFDDLRQRAVPEAGLLYLTNPQNPVGRVYTQDELSELSRFAQEKNLIVISDEVHCGLVYDHPHIPYFSVDAYAADHSVTLMGPGKTFNLAGLPFGFAVIPNESLRREFHSVCYALPSPGILNLAAAKAAYRDAGEWRRQLVAYLRGNRDYLEQELKRRFPPVKLTHVEGTYLQWLDLRPLGVERPWQWLHEQAGILTSDGKQFGLDGYIRLNFGTCRSRIREALDRIERGLEKKVIFSLGGA
jgi:cystathionine beta-lyase